LVLPHPFLAERAFVLVPFAEIAPAWRHPVSGQTTFQMLGQLGGARHLERAGRIERLDWKLDL
jgi:2-amino-4-hydroxy-6-hydroxymethyldihydropteridine diphosphokinase